MVQICIFRSDNLVHQVKHSDRNIKLKQRDCNLILHFFRQVHTFAGLGKKVSFTPWVQKASKEPKRKKKITTMSRPIPSHWAAKLLYAAPQLALP